MASIHEQIINATNTSTITQAQQQANQAAKSNSSSVQSYQFLQLLTEQLKYQDPTNPMDNSQMLAQEAQFSTLEQMEALQSGFSEFANIYKANSLVGQLVQVQAEDGAVSGKVDYIDYSDASGASVSINGKSYPLSSVTKVYPESQEDTKTSKIEAIADSVSAIADSVGNIAEKIAKYLKI